MIPLELAKLEDVITNLGSVFAAVQNTPNFAYNKATKLVYVPKNSGEPSSKRDEDLKMLSVHPTYLDILKKPTITNDYLCCLSRSIIFDKIKELPSNYDGMSGLSTKDDDT